MNPTENRLIASIDRRRIRPRPADELRRPDAREPRISVSARARAEQEWRALTAPTNTEETKL